MSRRDESLITCFSEATEWLEAYRHTITDEPVLRVIEQLEGTVSEDWDDLQNQVSCKEDKITELDLENQELKLQIKGFEQEILNIKAGYLADSLKGD